ncbi:MAG: imidazole glycerol phosphate synthase subunit HisH, partial [Clostridiales bacterium]|nr:imidazole glycerol phosphate synthase subunit HisH [Clostridiales bacterium]
MDSLEKSGLVQTVKDAANSGKPFLGICLGLQLLFESSEESPDVKGLGLLKGKITKIPNKDNLKVPQIGWNSLDILKTDGIFKSIPQNSYVYFVHSYYLQAENQDEVAATTNYAVNIHAAVEKGNIHATQFHPEKSGAVGLQILKNFVDEIGGKE